MAIFFAFQLLSFVHSFIAPCRHNQFHRKSPTYGISSPSLAVHIVSPWLDCLTVFSVQYLYMYMPGVGFEICYLANIFNLFLCVSPQNVTFKMLHIKNNQKGNRLQFFYWRKGQGYLRFGLYIECGTIYQNASE